MGLAGAATEVAALPRDVLAHVRGHAGNRPEEISALAHRVSTGALGWDGRSLVIEHETRAGRTPGPGAIEARAMPEPPGGVARQAP